MANLFKSEVIMAASLAELEIEGGITGLKCPLTGIDVILHEEGFDSGAGHSPHLRFFVDWIGQVWAADPTDLPSDQAEYQRRIVGIFKDISENKNQKSVIAECLEVLPKSALILEILDPPAGSFDGSVCYAGFDFGAPAAMPRVRLREVG